MDATALILLILFLIGVGLALYYVVICFQVHPLREKVPRHSDMGPLLEQDMNGNNADSPFTPSVMQHQSLECPDSAAAPKRKANPVSPVPVQENNLELPPRPVDLKITPGCASKDHPKEGCVVLPIDEEPSVLDGSKPLRHSKEPNSPILAPPMPLVQRFPPISSMPLLAGPDCFEEDGLRVPNPLQAQRPPQPEKEKPIGFVCPTDAVPQQCDPPRRNPPKQVHFITPPVFVPRFVNDTNNPPQFGQPPPIKTTPVQSSGKFESSPTSKSLPSPNPEYSVICESKHKSEDDDVTPTPKRVKHNLEEEPILEGVCVDNSRDDNLSSPFPVVTSPSAHPPKTIDLPGTIPSPADNRDEKSHRDKEYIVNPMVSCDSKDEKDPTPVIPPPSTLRSVLSEPIVASEPCTIRPVASEPPAVTLVASEPPAVPLVASEPSVVTSQPADVASEPSVVPLVASKPPAVTLVASKLPAVTLVASEPSVVPLVTSQPLAVTLATSEPSVVPLVTSQPPTVTLSTSETSTDSPLVSDLSEPIKLPPSISSAEIEPTKSTPPDTVDCRPPTYSKITEGELPDTLFSTLENDAKTRSQSSLSDSGSESESDGEISTTTSSDPDVTEYSFHPDGPDVSTVLANEVGSYSHEDSVGLTNYSNLPESPAPQLKAQPVNTDHPPTPTSDTTKSPSPMTCNDISLDEMSPPSPSNLIGTPPSTPPGDESPPSYILKKPPQEDSPSESPAFIVIKAHKTSRKRHESTSSSSSDSSSSTSNGSYKLEGNFKDDRGAGQYPQSFPQRRKSPSDIPPRLK